MSHAPDDPTDDATPAETDDQPDGESPAGAEDATGDAAAADRDESTDPREDAESTAGRRWAIRLLVGTAIGIPILIEARTFLGLLDQHFGDGGATDTETEPDTPTERRVGTGDELLPATPAREILRGAAVQAEGDRWTFEVAVDVENTTETPYEVRLGDVRTDAGTTVSGGASSGRVAPGGEGSVTGTWAVPAGEQPTHLTVSGITHGETTDRVRESVRLASVNIEG
jgi:hypothetical protein